MRSMRTPFTAARPPPLEKRPDANEKDWLWGIYIAETDRVVTSGIVNWISHMGSLNYGYAILYGRVWQALLAAHLNPFDSLIHAHREGKPIKMISGQMVQIYLDSLLSHPEVIPQDLHLDSIREDLTFRVVEIKRNHRYLSEIPYMPLGNGLAAVCDVKVQESDDGLRNSFLAGFIEGIRRTNLIQSAG